MLLNKNLRLMGVLKNQQNVDSAKEKVLDDLYEKTYQLFLQMCKSLLNEQQNSTNCINKELILKKFTINNYNVFSNKYESKITLNSDQIIYEQLISKNVKEGLYDWCKRNLMILQCKVNQKMSVIRQKLDQLFIDNCGKFYGAGQFPFIEFKIYKIGSNLYYAYNIIR